MPSNTDHPWDTTPATSGQALRIPNGRFQVEDQDLGVDFRFQIYTPINDGPVQGQRVIKIWDGTQTRYKAFGFVSRSGRLILWTRFQSEQGAPFVGVARALLAWFGSAGSSHLTWRSTTALRIGPDFPGHQGGGLYLTDRSRCCYECNALLQIDEIERGFCTTHWQTNEATNRGGEDARRNPLTGEQGGPDPEMIALVEDDAPDYAAQDPNRDQTTSGRPLNRCEVTGQYVQ